MTKIKMTPALTKHYAMLGKIGRKAVDSKYTPEQLKKKLSEWGSMGGRKKKFF